MPIAAPINKRANTIYLGVRSFFAALVVDGMDFPNITGLSFYLLRVSMLSREHVKETDQAVGATLAVALPFSSTFAFVWPQVRHRGRRRRDRNRDRPSPRE